MSSFGAVRCDDNPEDDADADANRKPAARVTMNRSDASQHVPTAMHSPIRSVPTTPNFAAENNMNGTPARNNATGPNEVTIKYKKQYFQLVEPPAYSLDETLANYERKSKIQTFLDDANTSPSEKEKLREIDVIMTRFITAQHGNTAALNWQPQNLVGNTPCVYAGPFSNNRGAPVKIGMSRDAPRRVERQKLVFAAQLMDREGMQKLVSDEVVAEIIAVQLPGYAYHEDHLDYLKDTIRMQASECLLGSSRRCCTETVLETMTHLPSVKVQSATATHSFPGADVEFMRNIPEGGVAVKLTWMTLPSDLQAKAKHSDFLPFRLRKLPENEFVTLDRFKQLLGSKFGSWEDAVKYCPRAAQIDQVLRVLIPLLKATIVDNVAVRAALAPLQGDNKSHYVEPSSQALAAGAKTVLENALADLPVTHVIIVERCSVDAMERHCRAWLHGVLNMKGARDLLGDDPRALCLVRAHTGHRVLFTASYFHAFSEKASHDSRIKSARAFLALLDLLHASGNVTAEHVARQRNLLRSYFMAMLMDNEVSESTGFRAARLRLFPKGYFLGSHPNVYIVSQHLQIGDPETLYLREELGEELMGKLFEAHGLPAYNPFLLNWRCGGTPACPGIEAEPCVLSDEDEPQACMVGNNQPHHVLRGMFCCWRCHGKLERIEVAILNQQLSSKTISEEGRKRLGVLYERAANKRVLTNELRIRNVAAKGHDAVQEHERSKNRSFQSRQNLQFREDPKSREENREKAKVKELNRRANGGQPKASVETRVIRGKKNIYPPFFMDKLVKATEHYIRLCNEPTVFWNHILLVFDKLLVRNQNIGKMRGLVTYNDSGKVMYFDNAYRVAVDRFLTKGEGRTRTWYVKNFVDQGTKVPNGAERNQIIEDVVLLSDPIIEDVVSLID